MELHVVNLLDFDAAALTDWFVQQGEKPFRAKQVLRWVHRFGATDFDQMTDVAKSLRAKLAALDRSEPPAVAPTGPEQAATQPSSEETR